MLAAGDSVVVAVSGGADSTALLYLLHHLAPEWNLRLAAVHVDHRLRPESAAEAEHVRRLGVRLGVPVVTVAVDVERRGSLEEAARRARYAALEAEAGRAGAGRIALGHTLDDQAETVLMRLLEGSGLRGLAGIPPVRGRIIRPLLDLRRSALRAALAEAGLEWVEDPSNRDPRFFRNRIRLEVVPRLGQVHGGDVAPALARVARRVRQAVEALEAVGARELARLGTLAPGAVILSRSALAALPGVVALEVLRQAVARLGRRTSLRAWAHRRLGRVLAAPPPRRAFRLGGATVEVSGDWVRVGVDRPPALPPRPLEVPGAVLLPEIGRRLEARRLPAHSYTVPREADVVAFDADRLPCPLTVRARQPGDRFHPFGAPGERRLKSFLIDAGVPRWDRDRVPLVEAGGRIVWVAGLRRAAAAPVSPGTREVVELALKPLAPGPDSP
ncbi:MAG TPA: tRNA lysidine(34) synthetase TilS [Candidatus Binatia bacterium]|nr:tRNA lysidine(34) synthetase TilS [Candidatus Binatia bacterium]